MRSTTKLFVTAFFIAASGIRKVDQSQPGQVDEVWNIGGPSPFRSPIENPRGGGCFPGIRMWTFKKEWGVTLADYAPSLATTFGFRHALQEGMAIDRKKGTITRHPCSSETSKMPLGVPVDLHSAYTDYIVPTQDQSDHYFEVLNVAVRNHQQHNLTKMKNNVEKYGWSLMGSAIDEGGETFVSRQVSHLIQHPTTRVCMLTFQGADGEKDLFNHFKAKSVDFCGLPSQVHLGFRSGLRHIVNNTDWQENIRSKLPSCSKVYATGHSLGGMKATLFAACANQVLKPGDAGYENDYEYMTWTAR